MSGEQTSLKPRKNQSPAIKHRDTILARISQGESVEAIAIDYGFTGHQGIEERLGSDPVYKAAVRRGLRAKMDKREMELEAADTNVAVTRADRLLGHARWMASKLHPEQFGDHQVVTPGAGLTINIGIGRTVDTQEPITITSQSDDK